MLLGRQPAVQGYTNHFGKNTGLLSNQDMQANSHLCLCIKLRQAVNASVSLRVLYLLKEQFAQ